MMTGPEYVFNILNANIYCYPRKEAPLAEAGQMRPCRLANIICPSIDGAVQVTVDGAGGPNTISAWATYPTASVPTDAYAMVYTYDPGPTPTKPTSPPPTGPVPANPPIPLEGGYSLLTFPPVPGAYCASSASGGHRYNYLVIWYKDPVTGNYVNEPPVQFTGYSDTGCDCGSGPGLQSGSGCSDRDGGATAGYGGPRELPTTMTYPATWKIEISGLEEPFAAWNNVYFVKCSHPSALNWDNGAEGNVHHRVAMKHCARTQTFTLTMQGQAHNLSARAPAAAPFAPLVFELVDMPSQHGKARIVATGVRG